jgi:hypothetical protein
MVNDVNVRRWAARRRISAIGRKHGSGVDLLTKFGTSDEEQGADPMDRMIRTELTGTEQAVIGPEARPAGSLFSDTLLEGPSSSVAHASIPKCIHYVWFGGKPLPEPMRETIAHWRRTMPDCRVIEWNESTIDVNGHPWMARMYAEGRYAFASDYARLLVLYKHGGIYLDTDVQMRKSLAPFMGERCLWSFEFDSFVSTCIIAAVPKHALIGALLKEYDRLDGPVVNNDVVTRFFLREFPEFRLNNKDQRIGNDIRVVPKEYFVVPSFDRSKNFAVHEANNQWKAGDRRFGLGRMLRAVIGDVLFFKLVNLRMNWRSEYLAIDRARHQQR